MQNHAEKVDCGTLDGLRGKEVVHYLTVSSQLLEREVREPWSLTAPLVTASGELVSQYYNVALVWWGVKQNTEGGLPSRPL